MDILSALSTAALRLNGAQIDTMKDETIGNQIFDSPSGFKPVRSSDIENKGWGVCFRGDEICILMNSDIQIERVHMVKLEQECEQLIAEIAKQLSKKANQLSDNRFSLTQPQEIQVFVEPVSRMWNRVQAKRVYKITGLKNSVIDDIDSKLDKTVKDFLSLGKGPDRFI